jgi:hypothetical protein
MLMVCLNDIGIFHFTRLTTYHFRSSARTTTMSHPRDETSFARPCMKRASCLASTRLRGHSVSCTHGSGIGV